MYKVAFGVVSGAILIMVVVLFWQGPGVADPALVSRFLMVIAPLVGVLFVWDSLRRRRRGRSLRCEDVAGRRVYVWTDLDGVERRSATDPRPEWDAEDRTFAD